MYILVTRRVFRREIRHHVTSIGRLFIRDHILRAQSLLVDYCAWMVDGEDGHSNEHQASIKDVQVHLSLLQSTTRSLDILSHTEYRSYHDKDTSSVKDHHILLPWYRNHQRSWCWSIYNSFMPDCSDHDEEAEEQNLNDEASDDNVVAKFQCG